jgi:hypothetical protein
VPHREATTVQPVVPSERRWTSQPASPDEQHDWASDTLKMEWMLVVVRSIEDGSPNPTPVSLGAVKSCNTNDFPTPFGARSAHPAAHEALS